MLSRHFVSVVENLVENGVRYADLSVEAIITAGGISRSTFYVYFDDKGDLLVAMAQDVISDLLADDDEVEGQLEALVEIVWRVVYLSGRGAASRPTEAPPAKPVSRNRRKSAK